MNLKQRNGVPKPQNKGKIQGKVAQDIPPMPQIENNTTKLNKDKEKWCELHKSSTHNTSERRARQSLVVELKDSESDARSNSKSEPDKGNDKGNKIINVEANTTIATFNTQVVPFDSQGNTAGVTTNQSLGHRF